MIASYSTSASKGLKTQTNRDRQIAPTDSPAVPFAENGASDRASKQAANDVTHGFWRRQFRPAQINNIDEKKTKRGAHDNENQRPHGVSPKVKARAQSRAFTHGNHFGLTDETLPSQCAVDPLEGMTDASPLARGTNGGQILM